MVENVTVKSVLSAHQAGLIEVALRHWAASETHHRRGPSERESQEAIALAVEILHAELVCVGEVND
ncbi:hypothetical protein O9X98_08865 [Agrobacterium salinitolerans]|nr:hypothetical protein [Agrobacterium salinitolerans]